MQIYWTLKSIPELAHLPRAQRRRAWQSAYWKTFNHWQTWAALVASGGCAVAGAHLGEMLGSSFIGAMAGGGVGGFIFSQVAIHVARRHYADLLLRAATP